MKKILMMLAVMGMMVAPVFLGNTAWAANDYSACSKINTDSAHGESEKTACRKAVDQCYTQFGENAGQTTSLNNCLQKVGKKYGATTSSGVTEGTTTSPGGGTTTTPSGGGSKNSGSSEESGGGTVDPGTAGSDEYSSGECVETTFFGCVSPDSDGGGIFKILNLVLNILTAGVGIAATIGFVIAGIQYMTAQDNEAQMAKAKMRMLQIVIGLFVYATMWAILNWILPGGVFGGQ